MASGISKCISRSTFPDELENADIIPVYNNKSFSDKTN